MADCVLGDRRLPDCRVTKATEIDLAAERMKLAVYRLWGEGDACLYVGQTTSFFPVTRILQHRNKEWWPAVRRADYVEVIVPRASTGISELLDKAEAEQIRDLKPIHNKVRPLG